MEECQNQNEINDNPNWFRYDFLLEMQYEMLLSFSQSLNNLPANHKDKKGYTLKQLDFFLHSWTNRVKEQMEKEGITYDNPDAECTKTSSTTTK